MPDPTPIPASLPDDPTALKALIARMQSRMDALEMKSLRLEMELLKYKKWMYGPRADKLASLDEVSQMLLGFGEDLDTRPAPAGEEAAALVVEDNDTANGTVPMRRVQRGRRNLAADAFASLPVTRHEHDLAEHEKPCPCCGKMRAKIGEESSWQIEYVPGHFERLEHVRFKYACAHCEQSASPEGPQIVRADKPGGGPGSAAIEKGLAAPGLLAFIVTSKFSDYTPLYRLEDIFERSGFAIARSTMSLWCRDVADLVKPLYDLMVKRVLRSDVIGTDDTIMPMLSPGAGRAKKARMWVYVGDEDNPYHVFDFTLSRSRDGPATFLKGYKGTLLADAYGGYDGIVSGGVGNGSAGGMFAGITRAGCWAHARRKFVDAEASHPTIAAEAVKIIGTLYAIEDRAKLQKLDPHARGHLRRRESAPILATLQEKLFAWRDQLLPKHPMAQAIAYALNQWNELTVFAGGMNVAGIDEPRPAVPRDPAAFGAVPIDNNASEREMKRIVLNRKNSLFVGNERAGHTAAILSSIASTCRRLDLDPQRYLTQLLLNLPATPVSQLDQWLPDHFKRRDPPPPM